MKTCITCKYFHFKSNEEFAWGNCTNEEVLDAQRIAISLIKEISTCPDPKAVIDAIANVLYRPDLFLCIYHKYDEIYDISLKLMTTRIK